VTGLSKLLAVLGLRVFGLGLRGSADFGLWRVYFPPVLNRTDRRLLV
jgi:hypothetical protein